MGEESPRTNRRDADDRGAVGLRAVARSIDEYLSAHRSRGSLIHWLRGVSELADRALPVSLRVSGSGETAASARLVATFLSVLPGDSELSPQAREYLRSLSDRLAEGRAISPRRHLAEALRLSAPLRLRAVSDPRRHFAPSVLPPAPLRQWIDVGLVSRRTDGSDELPFVPMSVFTREFFRRELPHLARRWSGEGALSAVDPFYYHVENDRAHRLRRTAPEVVAGEPGFEFYVDENGCVELAIDRKELTRSDLIFAVRLFCVHVGLRSVTIDGRLVQPHPC